MTTQDKGGRDGLVDAVATTTIIAVVVVAACLWLAGMPA
jgi:hypothetical protein